MQSNEDSTRFFLYNEDTQVIYIIYIYYSIYWYDNKVTSYTNINLSNHKYLFFKFFAKLIAELITSG